MLGWLVDGSAMLTHARKAILETSDDLVLRADAPITRSSTAGDAGKLRPVLYPSRALSAAEAYPLGLWRMRKEPSARLLTSTASGSGGDAAHLRLQQP